MPRRAVRPLWVVGADGPARSPIGLLVGGIWLVYLYPAAAQVLGGDWPGWQRVLGGVLLAAFVVLYLSTLLVLVPARTARNARLAGRQVTWEAPSDREMVARTAALAAIGLVSSVAFGGEWLSLMAFVVAVLAVVLDEPWPPRAILGTAALCEVLLRVRGTGGDSGSWFWLGFGVLVAGFLTYAQRRRGELEGELDRAREQNARTAVVEERARIGRDLHDLLGHSLSVIAVKSQLAERLLERGETERAADELRDVRGVAREALREVRHVVDGPRRRPLATELASCTAALRAGGLEVRVQGPEQPVPQDVEDVLSFVVREATTNVLRHARAGRCTVDVRVGADAVVASVADDGPAPVAARTVAPGDPAPDTADGSGRGLRGLADRLAGVGGRLWIGPGETGGTTLRASVPVPATAAAEPTARPVGAGAEPVPAASHRPADADGPARPAARGAASPGGPA